MTTITAKKYIYKTRFQGDPKRTDLEIVEETLRPLENGEILTEALFLSVDPYMRVYMDFFHNVGDVMIGTQIARVIASKHTDYQVGKYVVGKFGWRTHTITKIDSNEPKEGVPTVYKLPDFRDLPLSLGLGVLGMPGNTAYFGLQEICQPKHGETVVVSGAAGAVGSIVGQIAKLRGCFVIGIAGSDKKCQWISNSLNFDRVINYKKENVEIALKAAANKGVDCYFDNVGGTISNVVLNHMNKGGRIAVCGCISSYSSDRSKPQLVPAYHMQLISKSLRMEGFVVEKWANRWMEGIEQNLKWVQEGNLKYKETVTEGFENMYEAFVGMLHGDNLGKAIVKV